MQGSRTLKDDSRCSPKLRSAQQLRIGPGSISYAGIRTGGNYLTALCVSVLSHGKELDEPSVNINLHSKVGFLGERWGSNNIQKEAVDRGMRALASNTFPGSRTDFQSAFLDRLCLRTLCLVSAIIIHEFSRNMLGFSIPTYRQLARHSMAVRHLAGNQVRA